MFREISDWLDEPLPVLRLEIVRIAAPLAVLGFMSGRLAHADEWIGDAGFRVPDLGGDWRQPIFVPSLPSSLAWAVAGVMVVSGLACSIGLRSRMSAAVVRRDARVRGRFGPAGRVHGEQAVAGRDARGRRRPRRDAARPRRLARSAGGEAARPEKSRAMGSVRFLQVLVGHDLQRVGNRQGARGLALGPARPLVAPARQLPDGALLRARVRAARLGLDADAGARARLRGAGAALVRDVRTRNVRLRLRPRDAHDDRPLLRSGDLVRAPDDDPARGRLVPERLLAPLDQLAERLESRPRSKKAARHAG